LIIRRCSFERHRNLARAGFREQARAGLTGLWFTLAVSFQGPDVLTLGEFFIEFLNRLGKKQDDAHAKRSLKANDLFVRDFGAARLDVGQHVATNIHPLALHTRRQNFLCPLPLKAQFGHHQTNYILPAHDAPLPLISARAGFRHKILAWN